MRVGRVISGKKKKKNQKEYLSLLSLYLISISSLTRFILFPV